VANTLLSVPWNPGLSAYDRFPTFTAHTALVVKVSKGSNFPIRRAVRQRPLLEHCCRPPRRLRMAAILQAVTSASTRLGLIQISACAGSSRGTSLLAPLALETDGGGGLTSAAWTAVQSQERRDDAGGVTTGQGARCFACSSRSRAVSGRRVSV
jgi:hypothetical protein